MTTPALTPRIDFTQYAAADSPPTKESAQIDFSKYAAASAPTLSTEEEGRLHELYDSRPLWRKVLGLGPDESQLTDADKATMSKASTAAQKQIADQLGGVYSGMAAGAKTAAKIAPFMMLPDAGGAVDTAVGGGGLGAAANAGTQAAGATALTAAEGGDKEQAIESGAIAGVGPLAAPASEKLAQKTGEALEESAVKNYKRVLNPTSEKTKFTTNQIMPQLLQERPIAFSRSGLAEKAGEAAEDYGQQIEQRASTLVGQMHMQPLTDMLDNLKQSTVVRGVQLHPEAAQAIDVVKDQIQRMGADIPYADVRKARQIFDRIVAQAGGYQGKDLAEGSLVDIRREAANSMRTELGKASPDLAAVNAKFHFWNSVQNVATIAANKAPNKSLLLDVGVPSIAVAAHNPAVVIPAIVGKTIKSPAWNMLSGATKAKAAEILMNGNAEDITQFFTSVAAGANAQR